MGRKIWDYYGKFSSEEKLPVNAKKIQRMMAQDSKWRYDGTQGCGLTFLQLHSYRFLMRKNKVPN
jgi:hypothetical protein